MEIEEAVGIELDPELLPELATLDGLVGYIASARADA
jgi:acyl carrier protein